MLIYVEIGNVDVGIVYKIDVFILDKVKIGEIVVVIFYELIYYFLGVIKEFKYKKEVILFYEYL